MKPHAVSAMLRGARLLAAASLAGCDSPSQPDAASSPQPRQTLPTAQLPTITPVQTPNAISSLEDAQKFVLGTWTYTGRNMISRGDAGQQYYWLKWVIKEDGIVDEYTAHPTDSDWGKQTTYQYKIVTDKYEDTGKRYFGMDVTVNSAVTSHGIIRDDGSFEYALHMPGMQGIFPPTNWELPLTKGDKNPFSR